MREKHVKLMSRNIKAFDIQDYLITFNILKKKHFKIIKKKNRLKSTHRKLIIIVIFKV